MVSYALLCLLSAGVNMKYAFARATRVILRAVHTAYL